MDNGIPHTSQTYFGLLESAQAARSELLTAISRCIGLGDASLQVIPLPGEEAFGNNDNSVGLIVSYGEFGNLYYRMNGNKCD